MSLAAPALGRSDHYSTVVAVHGPNNSLWFYWNNDGDPHWNPSVIAGPGTTFAAPALARTSHESTVIAALGADNSLQFYWNNDGDPAWNPSTIAGPGTAYSAPSIFRFDQDGIQGTVVVAQGSHNSLSAYMNNDGDPTWSIILPNSLTNVHGVPAIVVGQYNWGQVLIVDGEHLLKYYSAGILQSLAGNGQEIGPAYSTPGWVVNSSNNWLLVAIQGPNNTLAYYWVDGQTWNPSVIAGPGSVYSAPSMGRTDHNSTVIAAQGPDNSLNYYWNNDGDPAWNPSVIAGPATTYSAPGLGRVKNESTIIVVHGPNSQLLFYWNNDGDPAWSSSVIGVL